MYIIPTPYEIKELGGVLEISTHIILDNSSTDDDYFSAKLLKQELINTVGECKGITKGNHKYSGAIYIKNKKIDNKSEQYTIKINEEKVIIEGDSSTGVFYGVCTLRQIIRTDKIYLHCVEINDKPSVGVRGCYIDITRGRVPKLSALKDMVDRLSFYKINHMQLYIEHTFKFDGFSEIYSGKGGLNAEDILELDEYAYRRHVELVPSIATFGHFYEVLQSEKYKKYCELENYKPQKHIWYERQKHHTINATDKEAIDFVKTLIDEFYPLFRTNKFNICGDETFDLAKGKNRDNSNKHELYTNYFKELISYLQNKGKQVMIWGSSCFKYQINPNELFSGDVIVGLADYNDYPKEEQIKYFSDRNITSYVVPGVHSWHQILNDYDLVVKGIKNSVLFAKQYKLAGVLNTLWGDYGHTCHFENSFPLLVFGADLSWNYNQDIDEYRFFEQLSKIEYFDETKSLIVDLANLSREQAKCFLPNENIWVSFIWWFYTFTIYAIEDDSLNEFKKQYITDEIRNTLKDCIPRVEEFIVKFKVKRCECSESIRKYIDVFINSAKGIKAISQALDSLIDYPNSYNPEAAEYLELWLDDFCEVWRMDNIESELYEVIKIIKIGSKYLRINFMSGGK